MRDTIRAVRIKNHLIDPTRAELWVTIVPNCLKQATEVRGRFLGPRCPYATTVEVAYPLQSFPHKPEDVPDLTFRVVIPEPSLWDPISPFLYEGYIGLWQNNLRYQFGEVHHGLRLFHLGSSGVRLNGQTVVLHGVARPHSVDVETILAHYADAEPEARRYHDAGYNLMITSAGDLSAWNAADRMGLLMLGWVDDVSLPNVPGLSRTTSALGWVLPEQWLTYGSKVKSTIQGEQPPFWGVELSRSPSRPLPPEICFFVCEEQHLPQLLTVPLPCLVLRRPSSNKDVTPLEKSPSGILGWVDVS